MAVLESWVLVLVATGTPKLRRWETLRGSGAGKRSGGAEHVSCNRGYEITRENTIDNSREWHMPNMG
jgi:hypothetical protein